MQNVPPQPSGWPVIGHDLPVGILRRSLRTGRLSHAYLFTGPEGVGKRTVAMSLAMAVNCMGEAPAGQPWTDVPCLLCPSCARIMRGVHPDVAEISLDTQAHLQGDSGKKGAPARELRIDVVREMQASIGLNPHSARRKVYLIGDADRLNEEASNCLLKTLEEPPAHSMLVLMAPDEESVLPTISSRCVQLQFRALSKRLVASSLMNVWGADEEQAETLASLSGGRVGYAVELLGNKQALSRRRAALEEAALLTGAPVLDRIEAASKYAKRYSDARSEVFEMLDEWETWWRDVMIVKVGAAELAVSVDQLQPLNSIARKTPVTRAADAVRLIQQTRRQLLENVNPRLALEALTLGLP